MARKQMINTKRKGSDYERLVASYMSKWWGCGKFHKTPASGGLHWDKDNRVVGDIVAPQGSQFPFVVECKKREGWNFTQILKGTGEFISYWEQVNEDVKRVEEDGLQPLLVMSKSHQPSFYVVRKETHDILGISDFNCFHTTIKFKVRGEEIIEEISIGLLDDLMKVTKEKVIEKLVIN